MKDYRKYIKTVLKNPRFELKSTGRTTTVKLVDKITGKMYSIHPGDAAIRPVKQWIRKIIM